MSKTIPQLKSIWNRERESYITQEVGSGTQRFVKDVLECTDIFNLKEGELSTPTEERKNEFIYEKKTRDRRRADFAIYINSDIIIPIEVEQYTNIEQGEDQLSQYQSDLQKKYGILTDGYTWRFYNNNIYRVFTLDHLLSQTDYFLEYWKEYIKPEYYYLSFFEQAGQLSFFGKEELHIEDNRQLFFKDITTLIKSLTHKLRIEGYFNGLERKEALKKATEITYAYIIQFILYKTLVDNKFDDFVNDYKHRIETIRNAIRTHSYVDILGRIDGMSHQIAENIYRPFVEEQEYIRGKLLELYRKAKNELSDVSPWLDIVVFIKKYNFQNVHNEIFGYVYENYLKDLLKGLDEEEKKGQYFTDPSVVNFMLEQVGYTAKEIRNRIKASELDKLSIVDPACGSGTFLYSATDQVVKSFGTITGETSKQIEAIVTSNVFGLDVEEFPLYLAEMSILMRMLPLIMGEKYNNPLEKKIKVFWTQDTIAEFIGSELITLGKQISFSDAIIKPKFESFVRSEEDLTEMKGSMTSFPRRRFDYVIANPPYVSYNECSKQGLLVFNLIKKKQVHLNDIFSVNLHSIPDNPKRYAPKPNLYAFFIALGLALLKDNGRLCYIIPQTVLVNSDLDVIRYHLAKFTTIERIITFSGKMFVGRGIKQERGVPTSSLILIVSNELPNKDHKVEIVNYKNAEDDIEEALENILKDKDISKKLLLQEELIRNVVNWNYIKQDEIFLDFLGEYKRNTNDLSIYYEHTKAMIQFGSKFYFDKGLVFPKESIHKTGAFSDSEFSLVKLDKARYTVVLSDTAVDSEDIRIPQGSQGLEVYKRRYKIVWSYMNFNHFYYSSNQIVLPYNFVIIASDNKTETMYLLSLLNSRLQKTIIEKSFKLEQEDKLTILLGIKLIKNQIRVPKITENNQFIKDEIISLTEDILALEEKTLSDFVDFSGVLMQKFDDAKVAGDTLVLIHDNRQTKLPIQGDTRLVASTIAEHFVTGGLKLENHRISLPELRNLQVIDFEEQTKLKNYIDNLVFALYFKTPLKEVGLDKLEEIQEACSKSKYYHLL